MAILLTNKDVVEQSNAVWNQFGESKWVPFAKANVQLPHRPTEELANSGIGKFMVCAAMGESLEESVPLIKKYRDRVDVLTCDKGFGPLLERGIKADYVMLCDCNIPFSWVEKYIEETKGVSLIATVYANTEWTTAWKGERYFFINKDAIQTERHFWPIFGRGTRTVPASTNVSNAMVVFWTGADENSKANWGGYEKLLLTGYDYSWRVGGNYYAFANPVPKRHYMTHRTLLDMNNEWVRTSENLFFSAKWFYSYITSFRLPVVNCSGRGILFIPQKDKLEKQLAMIGPREAGDRAREAFHLAHAAGKHFEEAKGFFEKLREELYQWPLETQRHQQFSPTLP